LVDRGDAAAARRCRCNDMRRVEPLRQSAPICGCGHRPEAGREDLCGNEGTDAADANAVYLRYPRKRGPDGGTNCRYDDTGCARGPAFWCGAEGGAAVTLELWQPVFSIIAEDGGGARDSCATGARPGGRRRNACGLGTVRENSPEGFPG